MKKYRVRQLFWVWEEKVIDVPDDTPDEEIGDMAANDIEPWKEVDRDYRDMDWEEEC